jgi:hypothetical protein
MFGLEDHGNGIGKLEIMCGLTGIGQGLAGMVSLGLKVTGVHRAVDGNMYPDIGHNFLLLYS